MHIYLRHFLGCTHDARMFDRAYDDSPWFQIACRALNKQVIGFRTAAGENHLRGVRAYRIGYLLARFVYRPAGRHAKLMTTGSISEFFPEIRQHGL